jgi:uncharacterized protein YkwD
MGVYWPFGLLSQFVNRDRIEGQTGRLRTIPSGVPPELLRHITQGVAFVKAKRLYVALTLVLLALSLSSVLPGVVVAGPPDPIDESPLPFPSASVADNPLAPVKSLAYPLDPTSDIPWVGDTISVTDIQSAFNNARAVENSQLGSAIPMLTLPSQAEWDAKNDGERALWLINRERIDRSVHPLHGLEANVTSVAQYYAQYLIDNNAWGHEADGRSPWQRLGDNPVIGACRDSLSVAENLAVFMTSGTSISLPVEKAIYVWMYEDGSSWGHRHAILWYPYTDNSGTMGKEGFLGIGRANGPYIDWQSKYWPYAEMIVMNVFDPCASWNYGPAPVLGNLPDALQFTYSIPDQRLLPPSHQVTPLNKGNDETLTWNIAKTGTWFAVSASTGNTPDSLWITPTTFNTGSVATYSGVVTVTVVDPAGVQGSPHAIDLTLRVVNASFSDVYLPLVVNNYAP